MTHFDGGFAEGLRGSLKRPTLALVHLRGLSSACGRFYGVESLNRFLSAKIKPRELRTCFLPADLLGSLSYFELHDITFQDRADFHKAWRPIFRGALHGNLLAEFSPVIKYVS